MTRFYDFTVSRGVLSPDGVNRSMILINGQFPGPTVEANWGDTISVTVRNAITDANEDGIAVYQEGTAMHWHGMLQKGTPEQDGVPGVSQCPIAPESEFTYTFTADVYGTSWYHSHYSSQYSGGVFGPMIIHGPTSADYNIDIGPVMISDWNHQDYYRLVQMGIGVSQAPVTSNNTLINGKMDYDCSLISHSVEPHTCTPNAGLAKFNFHSNKTHLLRLINPSAEAVMYFSIDEHNLTVIATDFVSIKPYATNFVTLGIGQRMDVLVTGSGDPSGAYWMRANASAGCSSAQQGTALAAIYYEHANTSSVPADKPQDVTDVCKDFKVPDDLLLTEPAFNLPPPAIWDTQRNISVIAGDNKTCNFLFNMSDQTFRVNYNDPLLLDVYNGETSFDPLRNLYNFSSNSTVLINVINNTPIQHPMHLHGHSFWVIDSGVGAWDGSTIKAKNTSNPVRRDTILIEPWKVLENNTTLPGYAVIGYEANNPGVWPFHCHIAWHVGGGMNVNLLEHPDVIQSDHTAIPDIMQETCAGWDQFTANNFVDQIDAGLRIVKL